MMDFSATDGDKRQHNSCSTAQAQAPTQVQVKKKAQAQVQAHAQVQEKTQAQAHAHAHAEQRTAVAGDSSGDEEQTEKLQELHQIVDELQKQILQQQKVEKQA